MAEIFIGDEGEWYTYKKGPEIVEFFNKYFGYDDTYGDGFPSRWMFIVDKLEELYTLNKLDNFLDIILSINYYSVESMLSDVECSEKTEEIYTEFRKYLKRKGFDITKHGSSFHFVIIDEDLQFIGSGGFADVYYQKSTGYVVKKLKRDYLTELGVKSRFKREFDLTKSLQDLSVIRVIDFDPTNYSYRMEKADFTLSEHINKKGSDYSVKVNSIQQILDIMGEVHLRDIIHRDLSPTNILFVDNILKIADFGLGKDLNAFASYQTRMSSSMGQFLYCAPEQLSQLKEGDKKSDVFSLGRVINFVMTNNPNDSHHEFRNISEKATNENPSLRYSDAIQLKIAFGKIVDYHETVANVERVNAKIRENIFDDEVESYIFTLTSEKLCAQLQRQNDSFLKTLILFMKLGESHALFIVDRINSGYKTTCKTFESHDIFARLSYIVLSDKDFSYVIKEVVANILNYIAYEVNRFNARQLIDELVKKGIDPMLESLLKKR